MPQGQHSQIAVLIGQRISALRISAGLSLSELARQAQLGKGTLSELESGQRNPTLETLYSLTAPLGVGLASLIDLGGGNQVALGSAGGDAVAAVLIDVIGEPGGTESTEVYRLEIQPGGFRISPAHGKNVIERLTLVSGQAEVGVLSALQQIQQRQSASWVSDTAHSFRAMGDTSAVGILMITQPARCLPVAADENCAIPAQQDLG